MAFLWTPLISRPAEMQRDTIGRGADFVICFLMRWQSYAVELSGRNITKHAPRLIVSR